MVSIVDDTEFNFKKKIDCFWENFPGSRVVDTRYILY